MRWNRNKLLVWAETLLDMERQRANKARCQRACAISGVTRKVVPAARRDPPSHVQTSASPSSQPRNPTTSLCLSRVCNHHFSVSLAVTVSTSHNTTQLLWGGPKEKMTRSYFAGWTFCCNKTLSAVLPLGCARRSSRFCDDMNTKRDESHGSAWVLCS